MLWFQNQDWVPEKQKSGIDKPRDNGCPYFSKEVRSCGSGGWTGQVSRFIPLVQIMSRRISHLALTIKWVQSINCARNHVTWRGSKSDSGATSSGWAGFCACRISRCRWDARRMNVISCSTVRSSEQPSSNFSSVLVLMVIEEGLIEYQPQVRGINLQMATRLLQSNHLWCCLIRSMNVLFHTD